MLFICEWCVISAHDLLILNDTSLICRFWTTARFVCMYSVAILHLPLFLHGNGTKRKSLKKIVSCCMEASSVSGATFLQREVSAEVTAWKWAADLWFPSQRLSLRIDAPVHICAHLSGALLWLRYPAPTCCCYSPQQIVSWQALLYDLLHSPSFKVDNLIIE